MSSGWLLKGRFDGESGAGAQACTCTARVHYAW
jgi:hypothetical protein